MVNDPDGLVVLENIPASVRCRDHAVNIFKYPDVSIDPVQHKFTVLYRLFQFRLFIVGVNRERPVIFLVLTGLVDLTTTFSTVVPNDASGRISLWSDIVKYHQQLQEIRAIEDFTDKDVTVSQGNTKKSVVVGNAVTVVNAMDKLYMTVTVR